MGFGLWYLESETGTHFNGHQRISTDLDRQALPTADTDHVPTLYTCGKGEEEVPALLDHAKDDISNNSELMKSRLKAREFREQMTKNDKD